jgi:hypothetical protein
VGGGHDYFFLKQFLKQQPIPNKICFCAIFQEFCYNVTFVFWVSICSDESATKIEGKVRLG